MLKGTSVDCWEKTVCVSFWDHKLYFVKTNSDVLVPGERERQRESVHKLILCETAFTFHFIKPFKEKYNIFCMFEFEKI